MAGYADTYPASFKALASKVDLEDASVSRDIFILTSLMPAGEVFRGLLNRALQCPPRIDQVPSRSKHRS